MGAAAELRTACQSRTAISNSAQVLFSALASFVQHLFCLPASLGLGKLVFWHIAKLCQCTCMLWLAVYCTSGLDMDVFCLRSGTRQFAARVCRASCPREDCMTKALMPLIVCHYVPVLRFVLAV